MNRDTVTGIVGAAILVVAMVGVFQYERTIGAARAGLTDGEGWELATLPGPLHEGEATLGGPAADQIVNVTQANLTNVTFTLKWTGPAGSAFAMAVDAPDDVTTEIYEADGAEGTLTITVPVANARPTADAPTTLGIGDWKVSAAYTSAGDGPTSTLPPPAGPATTATWTLTVSYEAWDPVDNA